MNDLQSQSCDDPRETLARSPMSGTQIAAVAVTVGLNALDGNDVLAISFAAPGIAHQWGLDRAALGIVLSMEFIGMGVGSIPARLRATGTGFAVGFGRAGSVLAPIASGFLFKAGYGLEFVATVMGAGSVVAAVAVGFLAFSGREAPQ